MNIQDSICQSNVHKPQKALRSSAGERCCDCRKCALQEAFNTDVEPLLKVVREEMGLDPNPLEAFRASGYWAKVSKERGFRSGAGLGA